MYTLYEKSTGNFKSLLNRKIIFLRQIRTQLVKNFSQFIKIKIVVIPHFFHLTCCIVIKTHILIEYIIIFPRERQLMATCTLKRANKMYKFNSICHRQVLI